MAAILFRQAGQHLIFRVQVGAEHCNGFHIAHGGFLSTMADIWLGYNVAHRLPDGVRFVTASLSIDFLKPVAEGHWIESEVDRVKLGATLCHATGAILSEGAPVATMRAAFARISAERAASNSLQHDSKPDGHAVWAGLLRRLHTVWAARATRRELSGLSDRMLKDIGVRRDQLRTNDVIRRL